MKIEITYTTNTEEQRASRLYQSENIIEKDGSLFLIKYVINLSLSGGADKWMFIPLEDTQNIREYKAKEELIEAEYVSSDLLVSSLHAQVESQYEYKDES